MTVTFNTTSTDRHPTFIKDSLATSFEINIKICLCLSQCHTREAKAGDQNITRSVFRQSIETYLENSRFI